MSIDEVALRQMLDKEAIRDVLVKYTRGMDRCDDAVMAQAYHDDACEDHIDYVGSASEFIKCSRLGHQAYFKSHNHYVTNQSIEIDDDVAHVESYFLAALRSKAGPAQMVGGRYVDRMQRRSGRWGIVKRVCIVEWQGQLNVSSSTFQEEDIFLRGERSCDDISYLRPLDITRLQRVPSWYVCAESDDLLIKVASKGSDNG